MTWAWVCAGVGLLCCLTPIGGIYFANEAKKEGHPQAQMAMIVNIVVLALGGLVTLFLILALSAGGGSTGY